MKNNEGKRKQYMREQIKCQMKEKENIIAVALRVDQRIWKEGNK